MATENQPDVDFTLTLDKKSGRPLSTLIADGNVGSIFYGWQRGPWKLPPSDVQSLNQFTAAATATTSTSGR